MTLTSLCARLNSYLLLEDNDAFVVLLGVVAAFMSGGDPVWLLIVAPPSGAKTALLNLLKDVKIIYWLSDLTPNTLASGYIDNDDASLLKTLNEKILVFKDLTTLLQMRQDDRQQVLAQLREIYDGQFNKAWGTGKHFDWHGRMGLIAGVTSVIDRHHKVMGLLGQRFVLFRLQQPDREAAARRAMENNQGRDEDRQAQLAKDVAVYLESLSTSVPILLEAQLARLASVASFITAARSPVLRDAATREFDYAPQPEMPGRFGRQLSSLVSGIARVNGHREVQEGDMTLATRVARDCVPPIRAKAIEALLLGPRLVQTQHVQAHCPGCSPTAVRRALEDLEALGIVEREEGGEGRDTSWTIRDEWVAAAALCYPHVEARTTPVPIGLRENRLAALRALEDRSGPRIVDSVLSEISTGFQAAVFTVTCSKYTASGVRRSSAV